VLIFHRTTHRPVGQRATQNEERERRFLPFPSLPLVAVPPITSTLHAAVHYNIIKRLRDQRPAAVRSGATLHLESSARGSRKQRQTHYDLCCQRRRPTLILATGQLPVLFIIIVSSSLYISTHSPPSERAEFLMRHSPVPREEQETDKCRQVDS
jgi:hypothetical protein